ncbi:MAG: hypothetical protein Fues2KO_53280 [Fuerstiella sp.]
MQRHGVGSGWWAGRGSGPKREVAARNGGGHGPGGHAPIWWWLAGRETDHNRDWASQETAQ